MRAHALQQNSKDRDGIRRGGRVGFRERASVGEEVRETFQVLGLPNVTINV